MKIIIMLFAALLFTVGSASGDNKDNKMKQNIYDFKVTTIDGKETSLADYKGKAMLIVNVASECGFTKQYAGLQELYEKYKDQGLAVLGFPYNQFGGQEPGEEEQIKKFCESKFGVTFPLFSKIDVNGDDTHPLYKYLKSQKNGMINSAIKWNFTKFLIDKNGKVVERFAPQTEPAKIAGNIKEIL